MLKIGGILKAKMHEKDIRQKELADMMELDQRTISNYCNDINVMTLIFQTWTHYPDYVIFLK